MKATAKPWGAIDINTIAGDFRGGFVSFLVAVPLCLGIALASGAPLFSGIIAGVVGGLVVGLSSRSALSISGPEAGLIMVVLSAMEALGSFQAVLLATCLAGIIQFGLGFARAGIISNFFPTSVIKGMLAGIGIILIIKQLPHLVGYDVDSAEAFVLFPTDGADIIEQFGLALGQVSVGAILIALVSLAVLILWERPVFKTHPLLKSVPAALIVVVLGITMNELFKGAFPQWVLRDGHLVQLPVPEDVAGFLGLVTFPDFGQLTNPQVYLSALAIALVASLEALLAIEATDELDPLKRKTPTNRELKAQGIGNLASGLVGGIPITSIIVRSSISINAGARTKRAALIHGSLLLVCVITLPSVLNRIPWAALASILLITGYKLARVSVFRQLYQQGKTKFLPFVTTVLAILVTDLLTGIFVGMLVGIFFILLDSYQHGYQVHTYTEKGVERFRILLGNHVTFLHKAGLVQVLRDLPDNAIAEIDGTHSAYIDSDVIAAIDSYRQSAQMRNIRLLFVQEFREDDPQPAHRHNGQRSKLIPSMNK
ncbi:SulP family inorganic anion transporter [Nibrella saemangeumensis]|uniref:SulP family inorganic anion transporter n=1 Tax=Nibrella saemangeumensis TaxID=1084526 RepID=A0ABP8NAI0_9BACT